MTRLYIVRHGRTAHNAARRIQGPLIDDSLDDTGRAQAAALAARFRDDEDAARIKGVYASPLKRATETAAAVADALGLDVHPAPGLVEFSWGKYLGCVEDGEVAAFVKEALGRWTKGDLDFPAPEGESPRDVIRRVDAALAPILERHDGEDAVLVAHGRVNKILLAHLVHGDASRMQEFPQFNTSVTRVTKEGDAWRVDYVNDQSHLPESLRASPKDVGRFV